MPQPNIPTLTVYKASAGSGKTFRLAIEYIKLLLEDPMAYEGILAVTFTNKATEEMKMRILSTLYGLSRHLKDSDGYMSQLKKETGLSEDAISQRSQRALRLLLHNYQYFKVQTIDTFFQSVLRNLARELQLSANLRVGLNTSEVVDEAVDEIIDSLDKDLELRHIVMSYIEDSIADDKQWNVIGNIKKFGGTIFSELYKQHHTEMDKVFSQKDFFERYKKMLYGKKNAAAEKYQKIAQDILRRIEERGIAIEEFAYGTGGPISYFLKISNGLFHLDDEKLITSRVTAGMQPGGKWYSGKTKRADEIQDFAHTVLIPAYQNIELSRKTDARDYKSAVATLSHLNDVQLLKRIETTARNLNDTSQRFMLSDTQSLLHDIIKDDDSPFIFEKIGSYLRHVMIDEFQDTSVVQWDNFKVLLRECMSQGLTNLIVGDVKQSIYRFRNGDWRLLNSIDQQFDAGQLAFPPMDTNWRSAHNVIAFNNAFFEILASLEVNDIARLSENDALSLSKAYADVKQKVSPNATPGGLVHIEMLPSGEKDTMEEHTLDTIISLLDKGVGQSKISILLRKGKDIPTMASYIERESAARGCPVKIVSSEAFRLDASPCVRIIVNAMTYLAHPEDRMALASLVLDFQTAIHSTENVASTIFSKKEGLERFLPEAFSEHRNELSVMSLSEVSEALVHIFSIDECKEEGAYVTTFFDCIHTHCQEQLPTVEDFLDQWASEYCGRTIETAETDGVRILTIHKSKGLEFDHVIIPYCNWKGNPPGVTTIWTTTTVPQYSELPLIPVGYNSESSLKGTIYENDGYREYIQNAVDNLNLLYVAMTRAKSSLFIFGERTTTQYIRSKLMCQAIEMLLDHIDGEPVIIENLEDDTKTLSLTFGHLPTAEEDPVKKQRKEEERHKNVFTPEITPVMVSVSSLPLRAEFRQSNDSRRFADDAFDDKDNNRWIRLGTIMHQVFSTIRTLDDVEAKLQRMEFDGSLYDKELTREQVIQTFREKFSNPQVRQWFSAGWRVFNECNIITTDGEQRPDRVITNGTETIVIDFKFGKERPEHYDQVRRYIDLLRAMSMPDVKGFLWYVTLNIIRPL